MSTEPTFWQKLRDPIDHSPVANEYMDMINQPAQDRGNRLCVSVSDIHLTDGTVGFQNLSDKAWRNFYQSLLQRCNSYHIEELLFVLDGDIVDMIRSGKWAENNIYPWEREREEEFSSIVEQILKDIVEKQHVAFFEMLRNLESWLKNDSPQIKKVKIVITVGNHDKELLCVPSALRYFYETALDIKLKDITQGERKDIGRMYGDERMFEDVTTAPYLPFYFGDTGFRFFTTHGQWRDKENCREQPAWSVADGWDIKTWQGLKFSPFLQPCFGDSVAAGVLSTFIYKVKRSLNAANYHDERLDSILDELDLYRPTYGALTRILKETSQMREENRGEQVVDIIQDTLFECVIQWLNWDFTYQTSSKPRQLFFKVIKKSLLFMQQRGDSLEIKGLAKLLEFLAWISRFSSPGLKLKQMRKFPAFLPQYRHYGFQIHGEGHTHVPLQEEPNVGAKRPCTYINFGTWRDQILRRKDQGYRRRGILRALYILDLVNTSVHVPGAERAFDYFVEDVVQWGDFKDAMDLSNRAPPKR
jgi:UDP-2,3-diacylglucosamine pyrophosphatase LpxH